MTDRNETLADIVAEMGVVGVETKQRQLDCKPEDIGNLLLRYAERIAAAAKREPVSKCNRLGNAAKMREVLAALVKYWDWGGYDAMRESWLKDDARAALAAPPRNCDVGTADEQHNRHDKYCNLHPTCRKYLREDSPSTCIWCFAKWAQRPYEAAQEGGDHADA